MPKVMNRGERRFPKSRAAAAQGKSEGPDLDLGHFKKLLLLERHRLAQERQRIRSRAFQTEGGLPADENWDADEDSADASSSMFDKEIDLSLEGDIEEMIDGIDNALEKIKNKTYGVCEMCGRTIAAVRLERIPFATLCVQCQSLVERL